MTSYQPLEVTGNLIALERGDDELLLINSFHMQPLYVARGRERFKRLLSRLPRGRALEELKSNFSESATAIQLLHDYKILISPAVDKERFTPDEMAANSVAPRTRNRMTAYLLLTESCNLSCLYCLNGSETYHKNQRLLMTPDTAIQSLTRCLDQLNPGGHLEVAFFGGEPLLNWDGLKAVIRRCEDELKQQYPDKRITYHLTSNLTHCPPDLVDYVRDYKIAVVTDIDGPPEIHDRVRPYRSGKPSHAQTADTVRRLTDAGLPVALRATVSAFTSPRPGQVDCRSNRGLSQPDMAQDETISVQSIRHQAAARRAPDQSLLGAIGHDAGHSRQRRSLCLYLSRRPGALPVRIARRALGPQSVDGDGQATACG
jgi:pyruvate-formate lyase-activating enzyme